MANFPPLPAAPYGSKAPFPSLDANTVSDNFTKTINASDGSSHAPTGDIALSGANGGGLDFSTAHPVPFKGSIDTSAGLVADGDLTLTGDLSVTTTGNITTTGQLSITVPSGSGDTAIAGIGDGVGAGVVGAGGTGVLGTGTSFGVVGTSVTGNVIGVAGGGHGTGAGGSFQGGATGKGVICAGGGAAYPALDVGTGGAVFTGTSPAMTADPGANNMLHGASLLKAWATVTTNGSGGVTLVDGYNIASIAVNANGVQLTFARAMASANYAAIPGDNGSGGAISAMPWIRSRSTSVLEVGFTAYGSNTTYNPSADPVGFSVVVFGRQ